MITRGAGRTEIGNRRGNNEDAFRVDPDLGLYVVSDGMGGHAAGEVASALAVEAVREVVAGAAPTRAAAARSRAGHRGLLELGVQAIHEACARIHARARAEPKLAGMGCAVTLVLTAGPRAVMAHAGDTRLYLLRDGEIEQLSTDHTMGAELVRHGAMTAAEAKGSRYAHALTRAVGHTESVEVDSLMLDLVPDDRLLLCTDGLSEYVHGASELALLLQADDLEQTVAGLIDLALRRGGRDNVTAVVVGVEASDDEQGAQLGDDVRRALRALRAVDLFGDVSFADLVRIGSVSDVWTHDAGATVHAAGAPCHELLVVLSGAFELRAGDRVLARLEPGDHVGDTTLLVGRPCRATLAVAEDGPGKLLVIEGERFARLAARRPWLGVALLGKLARLLSTELAETSDRLARHDSGDGPPPAGGPRHIF